MDIRKGHFFYSVTGMVVQEFRQDLYLGVAKNMKNKPGKVITDKPKTRELIAFSVDRERSDSCLILFVSCFSVMRFLSSFRCILYFFRKFDFSNSFLKKSFCFLVFFVRKRIMCIRFEIGSEQVGTFGVLVMMF